MEKTFEEKFGLKAEELEKILGGAAASNQDEMACDECFVCSECVGCSEACTFCIGDVV